jgi:hypothetical protein
MPKPRIRLRADGRRAFELGLKRDGQRLVD